MIPDETTGAASAYEAVEKAMYQHTKGTSARDSEGPGGIMSALKELDRVASNLRGAEGRLSVLLDEIAGPTLVNEYQSSDTGPGVVGSLHALINHLYEIEAKLQLSLDRLQQAVSS